MEMRGVQNKADQFHKMFQEVHKNTTLWANKTFFNRQAWDKTESRNNDFSLRSLQY
jgi:hypothetical protein